MIERKKIPGVTVAFTALPQSALLPPRLIYCQQTCNRCSCALHSTIFLQQRCICSPIVVASLNRTLCYDLGKIVQLRNTEHRGTRTCDFFLDLWQVPFLTNLNYTRGERFRVLKRPPWLKITLGSHHDMLLGAFRLSKVFMSRSRH